MPWPVVDDAHLDAALDRPGRHRHPAARRAGVDRVGDEVKTTWLILAGWHHRRGGSLQIRLSVTPFGPAVDDA